MSAAAAASGFDHLASTYARDLDLCIALAIGAALVAVWAVIGGVG